MAFYMKGKNNQNLDENGVNKGKGKEQKLTIDKRIVARKVINELNSRIDSKEGLSDVGTDKLLTFLQSVMPKEHKVDKETTVNYITHMPEPVIDITPAPKVVGNDTQGGVVD